MIIKLIAETEAERKRFGGSDFVEHYDIKEYFIAGNKLDAEGSIVDFHEWNGGFRYLIGTLGYFYELINDDRRKSGRQNDTEMPFTLSNKTTPMIKRSAGGNIQALDVSKLRVKTAQENIENAGEDEFVEDSKADLKIQDGGTLPEDEIDRIADEVANRVELEASTLKSRQGLRIIPNINREK